MNRTITPLAALVAVASLCFVACDDPGVTAQEKANSAQAEADKKIADARAEADKKASSAQADADKKIADAQADFAKAREDYRHSVQGNLDALDKKIADLDAKAKTATGKAKADLDAKLVTLHAQRDAFVTDFKSLDNTTATTWDSAKARLDKAWSELSDAVDHA